ncbi:MAG: DUF937 domain-containing protein [Marinomonas sp.]
MSLVQMLQQSGVIDSMAGELGVDPQIAKTAAGALLPAIVAGMGRSSTGAGASGGGALGGLGPLAGAIMGGSGGGGGLLDAVLGQTPTPTAQGNDILGNIFGSKDVSRGVAGEVAAITGIDEGLLKKMLPILAMAVAGYMAKKAGGGNGAGGGALGGILGSIVTGMMSR